MSRRTEPDSRGTLRRGVAVVFAASFVGAWLGVGLGSLVWFDSAPRLAASVAGALIGVAAVWRSLTARGRTP